MSGGTLRDAHGHPAAPDLLVSALSRLSWRYTSAPDAPGTLSPPPITEAADRLPIRKDRLSPSDHRALPAAPPAPAAPPSGSERLCPIVESGSGAARPAEHGRGEIARSERRIAVECAVALSYNGSTQAVMMASPSDLEDFARGFTLTEDIARPEEIEGLEVVRLPKGIELRLWLRDGAAEWLALRRRAMAGPVGCGLCGIDSLDEALRPPPQITSSTQLSVPEILAASQMLRAHQPLQDQTRAVHAAAFWQPGQGITHAREDVGRHNALDKLAGALIAAGVDQGAGAVVMTSRVSMDLVQKLCRMGAPILIAVSAPTSAALDLAEAAGLTIIALARGEGFEVFTHPHRIAVGGADAKGQEG